MTIARLTVLALAAALLAAPAASAATETTTTVERVPFDNEVFSECTGEDIDVEGRS
jgi:glutamine cyclotransferase